MKKVLLYTALIAIITCFSISTTQAQAPPHPGQTSTGGALGGQRIGQTGPIGAPAGNGTLILMLLAAAYAGRKTYVLTRQEEE